MTPNFMTGRAKLGMGRKAVERESSRLVAQSVPSLQYTECQVSWAEARSWYSWSSREDVRSNRNNRMYRAMQEAGKDFVLNCMDSFASLEHDGQAQAILRPKIVRFLESDADDWREAMNHELDAFTLKPFPKDARIRRLKQEGNQRVHGPNLIKYARLYTTRRKGRDDVDVLLALFGTTH